MSCMVKLEPSLTQPSNTLKQLLAVGNNLNFSDNRVSMHVEVYNESKHAVAVYDSLGMSFETPACYRPLGHLTVKVTYRWGGSTILNIAEIINKMEVKDQTFSASLSNYVLANKGSLDNELVIYLTLNIDDIDKMPNGIWLDQLNILLIAPKFRFNAFRPRDTYAGIPESKDTDAIEETWSTNVGMIYNKHNPNDNNPIYYRLGNDIAEVIPVHRPTMDEGLHVFTSGKIHYTFGKKDRKAKFIPLKDLEEHGYYNCFLDIPRAVVDSSKITNKKEVEDLMKRFTTVLNECRDVTNNKPEMGNKSLFERSMGYMDNAIQVLDKITKLKSGIDKVV